MTGISRRDFLRSSGVAAVTAPLLAANAGEPSGAPEVLEGSVDVVLEVNGKSRPLALAPETTLNTALREGCGLTGTKVSCAHGGCGACTVHVDGVPVPSCLSLAVDCRDRKVTTIESLAADGRLHPVQQAFMDADALQCGYCTPGFIMSGVAFRDAYLAAGRKDIPTDAEVAHALAGNVCRCGAQPAIIAAVKAATLGVPVHPPSMAAAYRGAGSLPRTDARDKVTGAARYTVDQQPPGCLHGAILRSPHAHARVRTLDLSAARSAPGVRAVMQMLHGSRGSYGRVRYFGQEIAAVAATTKAQARAALALIRVDYEVLPHVVDPDEAARPGAPLVYEPDARGDAGKASESPDLPRFLYTWDGNVRSNSFPLHRPDGGAAWHAARAAPVTVDLEVTTAAQSHATLEPHAAVAQWGPEGLTLWTGTQTMLAVQSDLAELLDVPASRVRVLSEYVGGAFGGKSGPKTEQWAAAVLAREAGEPVRVVFDIGEELSNAGHRPSSRQRIWAGADNAGRLRAAHHQARTHCGSAVGEQSTRMTGDNYTWDKLQTFNANVVTHVAPACQLRAPGHPHNAFCVEQAVDQLAAQLHLDPLLMRLHQERDPRRAAVMRQAHEAWGDPRRLAHVGSGSGRYRRGVGVATACWPNIINPAAQVEVRAWRNGHVQVSTATHDMGQGSRSVLQGIVHRRLGLPASAVDVRVGDTALPPGPGSFGSITTNSIAPALLDALGDLQAHLLDRAAARLGSVRGVEGGAQDAGGRLHPWRELMGWLAEEPWVGTGHRNMDKGGYSIPPWPMRRLPVFDLAVGKETVNSVQVAEVEVDTWLGRVHVVRVLSVLDAGTLMSPVTAHSQAMGGVIQGISYALYEARRMDRASGRLLNRTLETYGVLGIADAPRIDVQFLPRPAERTPHLGKGLGENSTIATAAAIGNAVFRALGVRIPHTPISPARVLAALGA